MNPFSAPDQLNFAARLCVGGSKTRKPNDRYCESPAIAQPNDDLIIRAVDFKSPRITIKCQSIHSMHPRICRDFQSQVEKA